MDHLHRKKRLSSFQTIILGFMGVILLGALLLMLPIATKERVVTPFNEALFTSTSAVCVTGLVLQDTATYWSLFGQSVILLLIQIGGLGVITVAVSFAFLSGRKISLMQRSTMQEAIAAPKVGGIVRLTGFILKGTFLIEFIGALCFMPTFIKDFGFKGIWMSFFHSISSFCNAGFDIMGSHTGKFSSLTAYSANPFVCITVIVLIIVGGIGFLTWDDVCTHRFRLRSYRMQSKVVLVTTFFLILVPFVYFLLFDFSDAPIKERILTALFQAVTPRTAGYNTVDLTKMTGTGKGIIIILMLIGGSPGSTAGGMKTTTAAVLLALSVSVFKRKTETNMFSRQVSNDAIKNAATVLVMYVTLFLSGAFIISTVEGLPIGDCIFETASAIGTVGLSLGITQKLGIVSQIILIVLMFLGRVGGLTLIYAAISGKNSNLSKYPQEKITVG